MCEPSADISVIVGQLEHRHVIPISGLHESLSIVIAVNAGVKHYSRFLESGRTVYRHSWRGNEFYFLPPPGVQSQPSMGWKLSEGSDACYPFWIHPKETCIDLVFQLMPQGVTTEHMHERERDVLVSEEFHPLATDGNTFIQVEGINRRLTTSAYVRPEEMHLLHRYAPGCSLHLLVMRSNRHRFPEKGGHILSIPRPATS